MQSRHISVLVATLYIRMAPFDGSAWEEEDDEAALLPDVPYYNNFPGKQPPPGGLVDMRPRPGATLVRFMHPCIAFTCNTDPGGSAFLEIRA